eukprot:3597546-Pyramimonas_sp.AAC.1
MLRERWAGELRLRHPQNSELFTALSSELLAISDERPVSVSGRVRLVAGELLNDAACVGQAGLVQHG